MTKINRVKIEDLAAASGRHAEQQIDKANKNGNAYLTATEAKQLSADLQDNFSASDFKQSWGSVKSEDLKREFSVMMEAFARSADSNRDGFLSETEAKALPGTLRDNFRNYLAAQQPSAVEVNGFVTRDLTSPTRIKEHLDAFGPAAVPYEEAFQLALEAVAKDEYGLSLFVREFGGEWGNGVDDPAEVERLVRELLKNGTMELVPVDADIPTGETSGEAWIFSVTTDGQGDHGVWAIVDRDSGSTSVSSFN